MHIVSTPGMLRKALRKPYEKTQNVTRTLKLFYVHFKKLIVIVFITDKHMN